jgi:hypothetical protein
MMALAHENGRDHLAFAKATPERASALRFCVTQLYQEIRRLAHLESMSLGSCYSCTQIPDMLADANTSYSHFHSDEAALVRRQIGRRRCTCLRHDQPERCGRQQDGGKRLAKARR